MNLSDPYAISTDTIVDPPIKLSERIKYLGPGFILSASIVGSGELIATTTLGAKAGFITFWVIIASCLIKVFVQMEFTKHTILNGKTAMSLISELGYAGQKRYKWPVWSMLVMMLVKFVQIGGIVGGVAIILSIAVPELPEAAWSYAIALVVGLIVFKGYYKLIEGTSIVLMGLFTVFTACCLVFTFYTPYSFDFGDILAGLTFELPKELVPVAIGAFGITGMSGEEILYYNYWCLEKGYARSCGPRDNSNEWKKRARGWINMMQMDALVSMCIYTVVTAIFYLLGASILHVQGKVPEGYAMIQTLSAIYTESLGGWARPVFLIGSFFILFSTLFAALASWTRLFPDIFSELGWVNFRDAHQRNKLIKILAFFFPLSWATLFVFIELPVIMIISGGIIGSVMLLLVIAATVNFRLKPLDGYFNSTRTYTLLFWSNVVLIFLFSLYGLLKLFL